MKTIKEIEIKLTKCRNLVNAGPFGLCGDVGMRNNGWIEALNWVSQASQFVDTNEINEKFDWWYRHTFLCREHNPCMFGQAWIRMVALEGFKAGLIASQQAVQEGRDKVEAQSWWCCKADYPDHEDSCPNSRR